MTEEHKVSFLSGLNRLHTIHGITIDENDYIELAFIAWDKIGDRALKMYHFHNKLNGNSLTLPCNFYSLEALITERGIQNYNLSYGVIFDYYSKYNYKLYGKPFNSDLYNISGNYINYSIENNELVFGEKDAKLLQGTTISVYYKGILSDSDGYPLITDRQAEAISYYIAYIMEHRKVMRRVGDANLLTYLKQEWSRLAARARVDEYISQNAMDAILDAQTSWDRKKWNVSLIV